MHTDRQSQRRHWSRYPRICYWRCGRPILAVGDVWRLVVIVTVECEDSVPWCNSIHPSHCYSDNVELMFCCRTCKKFRTGEIAGIDRFTLSLHIKAPFTLESFFRKLPSKVNFRKRLSNVNSLSLSRVTFTKRISSILRFSTVNFWK